MASQRLAYLGPAGTYSEQAALLYDREARLLPFTSFPAIVQAVESAMADLGCVPIENSIEGTVPATVDLLIHESNLSIRDEIVLPIESYLLAKPGTEVAAIEVVYSHPQALGQCRRFVDRCFPKAQVVASLSTTAAVEEALASDRPAAAIAPRRAAEVYEVEILASNIQDAPRNATRFVILAADSRPKPPTGDDKTSICFALADDDKPGTLVDVLYEFAKRRINMTKIESRPSKESLGTYIFLIDLQGHRDDAIVAECLAEVRAKATLYKLFGSYPRFRPANLSANPSPADA